MQVGIPKETKDKEHRVALTPGGAKTLHQAGHTVLVQAGAGLGAGFSDAHYLAAGARVVPVEQAWEAELVLKVKEPLASEYHYLKEQILFTYLPLAGGPHALTKALLRQHTTAVAYETVEDAQGTLPLLAPMSAIAGNMAITIGSYYLAGFNNGKGIQLGTILGTRSGKVVIIGDGVVGQHAAKTAAGIGAQVVLCGRQRDRAAQLTQDISPHLRFFESTPDTIADQLAEADLVVGAVLVRGAKAPYVVTEAMVQRMQPGSVIVDVSIDQGGCIATSRPTSHSAPVFETHGVIHYGVTNMPGAYPRTSTLALTTATLPYMLQLAQHGLDALRANPGFGKGVNTYKGYITSKPVAEALGLLSRFKEFDAL
ncbi:MAG TPA: alanine dehydrogenase [Candidatus Tectomicrobia bacterium]